MEGMTNLVPTSHDLQMEIYKSRFIYHVSRLGQPCPRSQLYLPELRAVRLALCSPTLDLRSSFLSFHCIGSNLANTAPPPRLLLALSLTDRCCAAATPGEDDEQTFVRRETQRLGSCLKRQRGPGSDQD